MNSRQNTSPCPAAARCGGCRYQGVPYSQQVKDKQQKLQKLLGGFAELRPMLTADDPLRYRCKVQAAFGYDRNGNIISGTYEASTHRIVPVESCQLENEAADAIIGDIRRLLPVHKLTAYREKECRGFLRHVLIRVGSRTGQLMVVLVTAGPAGPGFPAFLQALLQMHPEITTVVQNFNSRFTSMVLGDREKVLYGPGYIEDSLCGLTFRISPKAFYQVNPPQAQKLYDTAVSLADLHGWEWVLDAYCGTGTIGLAAAAHAGQVTGVELNRDAVSDAVYNARRNHIRNACFAAADAGRFLQEQAKKGARYDVVIMDPPRTGSSPAFLQALIACAPEKIVYVSCGPDSLARDLKQLTAGGYSVRTIQPVDMFPFTEHIETVCLLVLRNPVTHINIDVDVEELVQDKRGQATYPQIKEYVLEQTGLKVSSLYISQIKRKCGLDVGENYNKPKSEDAHVPQCPPEKEKAIIDALRHFGMVS